MNEPAIICRLWHGRTPRAKADAYAAFLERRAVDDYRSVPGNLKVEILRRDEGEVTHFLTVTHWQSEEAIRAFAGDDLLRAKYCAPRRHPSAGRLRPSPRRAETRGWRLSLWKAGKGGAPRPPAPTQRKMAWAVATACGDKRLALVLTEGPKRRRPRRLTAPPGAHPMQGGSCRRHGLRNRQAGACFRRLEKAAAPPAGLGARIDRYRCCLPALAGFSI